MTRRGPTRAGQPAPVAPANYNPASALPPTGSVVHFHGEDGRTKVIDLARWPLPGWHPVLAPAIAAWIGPGGGRRTFASAKRVWTTPERFLRYLATADNPPATPQQATVAHLEAFHEHVLRTGNDYTAWYLIRELRILFCHPSAQGHFSDEVLDWVSQPAKTRIGGVTGYTDGEFTRIVAAARRDTAIIRNRVFGSHQLLHGETLRCQICSACDHALLAQIAATGEVPAMDHLNTVEKSTQRLRLAGHLYLTNLDVIPLLALMIAVTGRNIETIKELPAEHRVLGGKAVELQIIKRRRGARNWYQTVVWEIGPPGRELHTPGGLYLMILALTEGSRKISGSRSIWSIWRHGAAKGYDLLGEHTDPFAGALEGAWIKPDRWSRPAGLLTDAPPGEQPRPLRLNFQRLKTSAEALRTKQLGGHLPSAARSNTMPVLFAHYLRGDPTVISWAEEIVAEAVVDAEQAALAAHERAKQAAGAPTIVTSQDTTGIPVTDAAWTSCTNPQRHPLTNSRCQATFLSCFHCGNCVITRDHLPRILDLLDALEDRRQHISQARWWAQYGPAWTALRRDVLPKFTAAELEHAATTKTGQSMLDLVDNAWETTT